MNQPSGRISLKRSAAVAGLAAALAAAPVSAQQTVSWWVAAPAVPVAAYAGETRLSQDALMLKGLGRTVLPMRALFSALGATVEWDARSRAVTAWMPDGTGVRFPVGSMVAQRLEARGEPGAVTIATLSEQLPLDAPAMLIDGQVYVPVRAAAEALGTAVLWDGNAPSIRLVQADTLEPAVSADADR